MKKWQSHSLIQYFILALVLSAVFLAFMYTTGLQPTGNPEPTAAITRTGAVLRSAPSDSYDQRFRQLEQWLGQTQDAYEARFAQLEQRLVQTTSPDNQDAGLATRPYEAKLNQLELWLGQTQDAYEARFEQLEQRLVQATAPQDDRLLKIEQQLAQVIDPQVERLKTIEASLAQTTSRLDELSVSLAALTDDTTTIIAANKTLRAEPPAALQHQPRASAPQARPQSRASVTLAQVPGTGTTTEPLDQNPAVRASQRKSKWAINLASYVSRKTASRKMDSFQEKGIAAEMVTANVRGQTIYRVRLAGFDTLEDARAMAPTVRRQLGLKETWIMAN
jgi:hypothetical protein